MSYGQFPAKACPLQSFLCFKVSCSESERPSEILGKLRGTTQILVIRVHTLKGVEPY